MTNGTLTTFENVQSFKAASQGSLDPGLASFSANPNDINMAKLVCGPLGFEQALALSQVNH